ncbi:hypothetical protein QSE00_19170 [Arenibacter sp. M-2]|uniref:hypothetical protein n=1 Tax=Arenibacter sp. M-2 TaxID=3053612 RepID=UPI002570A6FB|nr:hypothetical protein [Arenibacter sp. M-2]MDL5513948.1 hypothetical protein [Arenibacter sp. M-2]|tara:strand:- start:547 stop:942 length:396 start_codon:yes stop_codon:yes gene_type:complete
MRSNNVLEKNDIPFSEVIGFSATFTERNNTESVISDLTLDLMVEGIFLAHDFVTVWYTKYFQEHRIGNPQVISRAVHMEGPIMTIVKPTITTVDQPRFDIGRLITSFFISRIESEVVEIKPESIVLKPSIL